MQVKLYAARVKTRDGQKMTVVGSFNDCLAFIHELGDRVRKARVREVSP